MRSKPVGHLILGILLAAASLVISNVAQAGMTILNNNVKASVYDRGGSNSASASYTGTSIPVSHLVDATAGDFYSRIQLDYAQSGTSATISNSLTQKRDGGFYDYAQAYDFAMLFTVDADTTYDLSGTYSATDVTSPGMVYLAASLRDMTAGDTLAYSEQYSFDTPNESFTLGVATGDRYNDHSGSFTGNLFAGRIYKLYYSAYIQAVPTADGGASATGNITLQLGDGVSAVPEPASLAIWGLGVFGLGLHVRRRQRRQHSQGDSIQR